MGLGITANSMSRAQAAEVELQTRLAAHRQVQQAQLNREITCMARNIYFESASEPYRGKVAVAQVTMNRVRSGAFPSTVCGVVHQKTQVEGTTICQFSWTCVDNLKIRAPKLYEESRQVAYRVLVGGLRLPELKHAMFFHADYIKPDWKKKPKAQIGHHIFY